MLRWKYKSAEATFVEVGGEVLPVEHGLLPPSLSPAVLAAVELSPHFVQVDLPEDKPKAPKGKR